MTLTISTRRQIGKTALNLPVFGFGTAHIGELYATVTEEDSRATLESAWNKGIRYYDTAPWYGRGLAEHRLGGMLRTLPRDEFQITTKVGRTLMRPADLDSFSREPWVGGLNFEVHFDYSYDGIMRSYEQGLQRLALDTVDALVIHDLDSLVHDDAAMETHQRDLVDSGMKALEALKASGDIKAYGMGININETLETVAQRVDLDFALVAMPYTLLDQASLNAGMADCARKNTSVIIGAPFASGILATGSGGDSKYRYATASPEIMAKVKAIEVVCRAHGVPLPAAALQFPLAHPSVASTIPGAVNSSQVMQNIDLLQMSIPQAFWSDLKDQGLIHADAPTPLEKQGEEGHNVGR